MDYRIARAGGQENTLLQLSVNGERVYKTTSSEALVVLISKYILAESSLHFVWEPDENLLHILQEMPDGAYMMELPGKWVGTLCGDRPHGDWKYTRVSTLNMVPCAACFGIGQWTAAVEPDNS